MSDHKSQSNEMETAVLVGIISGTDNEEILREHLDELAFLAETAGAKTLKRFWQKLPHPDPRGFVGKGKLEEISEYINEHKVDAAIFDDDLSGTQINNIEKALECKVLDRSHLILDIFALRARTAQAKTQVELAQMNYLLPRLRGLWTHLERQKGGIGLRGPGEKEIETDRRVVNKKISRLKAQLEKIDKQNVTRRKSRSQMIRVALVGYTNVGKSTLMRILSKEDVFAENKLFATLDTTVRKVVINNIPFLLSDTVGFIRKLPHHLVESFKSTLDEVREADILLHVVDIAHPFFEDHIEVVNKTLDELGANENQVIMVFNKMDLYRKRNFDEFLQDEVKQQILQELNACWQTKTNNNAVFISALAKENIDELRNRVYTLIKEKYLERYPYKAGYFHYEENMDASTEEE